MQSKSDSDDAFKTLFKYYKRKQPPPDLSFVIDFQNDEIVSSMTDEVKRLHPIKEELKCADLIELGLKPLHEWKIFQLEKHPGFLFIQNPFTKTGSEYWIHKSFSSYCLPPNPTNMKLESGATNYDSFILQKLRWATLGYHHNWDTKEYSESFRGTFPPDLSKLSKTFANILSFKGFVPEAAIVNYYSLDSSLGGHTDHSEKNLDAPLFSISFGQTAIFLLGGTKKSDKPSALFIRSGDVVVMSGKSRLCFHAVPKIVKDPHFNIDGRWSSVMSKMRLNFNVRQVNSSETEILKEL